MNEKEKDGYIKQCLNELKRKKSTDLDDIEPLLHILEFGCECPQVLIVDDIDMNRYIVSEMLKSKFGLTCE